MKQNKVTNLVKPAIRALQAYQTHQTPGLVKLDAMENPYQWPAELMDPLLQILREIPVNRYPDSHAHVLKEKIRECFSIPADLSIMLGNGSDELIQILAMSLSGTERVFMAAEPGFAMYRMISNVVGAQYVALPLRNDTFELDIARNLEMIEQYRPALLFIAYPNNPTGNLFSQENIIRIIEMAPGMVVIDEAYQAFSGASFLAQMQKYEHVVLMRTLSKSGMAGLRLGYLLGHPDILSELEKVRLPYNINVLSQVTAEFMLQHHDVLQAQAENICRDRELLLQELETIAAIKVWPSSCNFLIFRCTQHPAMDIYQGLKTQGILIKNMHGQHPQLENCLRVTIGTPGENRLFTETLKSLLA